MRHLRQPRGSSCCGQTCVAMVMGASLDRVICAIGDKGTHYKTLRKAVHSFLRPRKTLGPIVQGRFNTIPNEGVYIARIIWCRKPHASHFIVVKNGWVSDPEYHGPVILEEWLGCERKKKKLPDLNLTSWVQVLGRPKIMNLT